MVGEQLRASQEHYHLLFECNPLPMWVYDIETLRFLDVNEVACIKYGFSRQEFLSMTIRDVRPVEDIPSVEESVLATRPREVGTEIWRHRTKDGVIINVQIASYEMSLHGRRARFVCPLDITARIALEAALREREAALSRAEALAKLAHIVTRPDGSFESWSDSLPRLIGLDASQIPSSTRGWLDLLHPDDRRWFRATAIDAARMERRFEVEYRMRRGPDEWIHVRQVIEPMQAGPGGPGRGRWFSTLQDVTEQKRAEEQVRRLNADLEQRVAERTAELEAANKELEAFDYSVSHDLRAPLRHIQGFGGMLLSQHGEKLDENGQDCVKRVLAASKRMDQLVTDLLHLSTATRGELHRADVDVSDIVEAVLANLKKMHVERQVVCVVQPGLRAHADPGLLHAVLDNLLGNAWKFTRNRADARIEFGTARSAGQSVFFVRDNGAGFDMAYEDRLFAPLQRLHSQQEFEGTGVGLATVQRIIRRHGGKVWAESSPDEGATFYFTF